MKAKILINEIAVYSFVLLFIYTATSKLWTMQSFQQVLARSPIIGPFSDFISWLIPAIEIIIAALLLIPKTSRQGLTASLILLVCFTVYLSYMVLSKSKLPCSCGGVISKLSWKQHVLFNCFFIILAVVGKLFQSPKNSLDDDQQGDIALLSQ